MEGEAGAHFYIVQEGEAVVYQRSSSGNKKINHLFKVGSRLGSTAVWRNSSCGLAAACGRVQALAWLDAGST